MLKPLYTCAHNKDIDMFDTASVSGSRVEEEQGTPRRIRVENTCGRAYINVVNDDKYSYISTYMRTFDLRHQIK